MKLLLRQANASSCRVAKSNEIELIKQMSGFYL